MSNQIEAQRLVQYLTSKMTKKGVISSIEGNTVFVRLASGNAPFVNNGYESDDIGVSVTISNGVLLPKRNVTSITYRL